MKYQISSHDYELISAYLDNQLSDKDRARFDSRLKADPELRNELNEISKTRMLVHNLPRLRAPRNYFIKAAPVPVRPLPLRLAPVFGIVSAAASVLLVLVIFGNVLFKSRQPVAMAPVSAPLVQETQTSQVEVQRNAAPLQSTTEAPPLMMMTAPMQEASPTPFIVPELPGQAPVATPTTIYMFAYAPSATPENMTIMEEQQQANQLQCQQYYGGAHPPLQSPNDCPSPTPTETPSPTGTSTSSQFIQESLGTETATPTETPTLTETPTATATETPTLTPTASPTPSPTPPPTQVPPAIEKAIPTGESPSALGLGSPNTASDTGVPTPTTQEQAGNSGSDASFLNYLLLTVELSLASIAVLAGIIAIIFRIRAGR